MIGEAFVSALLGVLLGGGGLGLIGWWAATHKMIGAMNEVFARRSELRDVARTAEQLHTLVVNAGDMAANANERLTVVERDAHHGWQRYAEKLDDLKESVEHMGARTAENERLIERTVTLLSELEKRMDRHAQRHSGA